MTFGEGEAFLKENFPSPSLSPFKECSHKIKSPLYIENLLHKHIKFSILSSFYNRFFQLFTILFTLCAYAAHFVKQKTPSGNDFRCRSVDCFGYAIYFLSFFRQDSQVQRPIKSSTRR